MLFRNTCIFDNSEARPRDKMELDGNWELFFFYFSVELNVRQRPNIMEVTLRHYDVIFSSEFSRNVVSHLDGISGIAECIHKVLTTVTPFCPLVQVVVSNSVCIHQRNRCMRTGS